MRRYGGGIELVADAQRAGLRTVGVAIHPPLAGDDDRHRVDIDRWLPEIDPSLDVWVSHLSPDHLRDAPRQPPLQAPARHLPVARRPEALHLEADVLDTRPVGAGERPAIGCTTVPGDGTLVMIGAGTANGVTPLADGRSPFHFDRRRLELLEPPHMHTSMAFVPDGDPCPTIGDWVDLQRPLTMTTVDELRVGSDAGDRWTRRRHADAGPRRRPGRRDDRRRGDELPRLPDPPRRPSATAERSTTCSTRGPARCRPGSQPRSCSTAGVGVTLMTAVVDRRPRTRSPRCAGGSCGAGSLLYVGGLLFDFIWPGTIMPVLRRDVRARGSCCSRCDPVDRR